MTRDEFSDKFFGRGMASFSAPGGRVDVDTTDLNSMSMPEIVERVRELLDKQRHMEAPSAGINACPHTQQSFSRDA